jgi:hypothetical protein
VEEKEEEKVGWVPAKRRRRRRGGFPTGAPVGKVCKRMCRKLRKQQHECLE